MKTTVLFRIFSFCKSKTPTSLLIAAVEPGPVNIRTSSSVALTHFLINDRESSRYFVVFNANKVFSLCVFA